MGIEQVKNNVFPEVNAGGFIRCDGTLDFYSRINALIDENMVILDYGAGRGAALQDGQKDFRFDLRCLKGKVRKIIGCDVDPTVMGNNYMDECHVIKPNEKLPFEDNSFDLIYSDYVFEHIENPEKVCTELNRILKKDGWIIARTPNLYGYIAISTMLTPRALRKKVLKFISRGQAGGKDNFPVELKLNCKSQIRKNFPEAKYHDYSYYRRFEGMGYFGRSELLLRFVRILFRFLPDGMSPELFILLNKK